MTLESGGSLQRLVADAHAAAPCSGSLRRRLAVAARATIPCGGGSREVGLRRRLDIMADGRRWRRRPTAARSGPSCGGSSRRRPVVGQLAQQHSAVATHAESARGGGFTRWLAMAAGGGAGPWRRRLTAARSGRTGRTRPDRFHPDRPVRKNYDRVNSETFRRK